MLLTTMLLAGFASAIHLYIFVLESLLWDRDATRKTFGVKSEAEVRHTRQMAFNQGFYNLFLAILTMTGMTLLLTNQRTAGATLLFAGTGSMVAAGLVLLLSSPKLARAALVQLLPPAAAIIFGVLALTR
ncbi:MAG: DUF1304 domain-containing protein [Micrococcaceae bacterium]|nr:DUF1304 domain-containing protein [Micrococcaceae bacterium]